MILEDYLSPIRDSILEDHQELHPQAFVHHIIKHTEMEGIPDLENVKLAIIGVMEDRGAYNNEGCDQSPDTVRDYLYPLFIGKWNSSIVDLGNIYAGESLTDSHVAVKDVCLFLLKKNILPILIGGSQDITYSNYRAYDGLEQTVNLVSIDPKFNLGNQNQNLNSDNFLSHVILQKPYILFNFSNIGYQTYFVNQDEVDLMEKMFFDVHRLGLFRDDIKEAEPILRDADIVSFDLSAIRQSDAPGNLNHSPNGFTGEEACALSRYAGISDKVSSFGIYELNPEYDNQGRTAHLVAQMIWYFIEGYNNRKGDYPFGTKDEYDRFIVLINEGEHELVFYRSNLSDRWWVEVPIKEDNNLNSKRHKLVPCSQSDYAKACENDIPVRWWQALNKTL